MKLLVLLSVGLGLASTLKVQSQVSVQLYYEHEKFLGPSYTLKLSFNDRTSIEEEGAYESFLTGIALLDNGNLNATYFHRKNGKYMKEFYVAEKTDTTGRYTFDYHGKNYLTFVAVTENYTIMDLENKRDGNSLIVVKHHGYGSS